MSEVRLLCGRSERRGGRAVGTVGAETGMPRRWLGWSVLGSGGKPGGGGYGSEVSAMMGSGAKGVVRTGLAITKVGSTTLDSCTIWSSVATLGSGKGLGGSATLISCTFGV